jgi:hypothetical protein
MGNRQLKAEIFYFYFKKIKIKIKRQSNRTHVMNTTNY